MRGRESVTSSRSVENDDGGKQQGQEVGPRDHPTIRAHRVAAISGYHAVFRAAFCSGRGEMVWYVSRRDLIRRRLRPSPSAATPSMINSFTSISDLAWARMRVAIGSNSRFASATP